MICFEILSDFWRKSQKGETRKNMPFRVPTPQRKEPTPRHSPTPQHGVPSPQRGQGAKMAPPLVRYRVALLCRSVAMLRRGVDTVHSEENFGFLF